jgi:lipoate-protein ligase A
MKIRPYRLEGDSPLDHLAMESVLLDTFEGTDALLLFYINTACVIIGRNQNPWREMSSGTGLPLFRRVSGGGAVYHDRGNLNWSLILPRELHSQGSELAVVAAAISAQGFDVVPGERGGLYFGPSSPHAGEKVSGTARRFGARRVLHHGTLLVDADLSHLHASLHGIATFDDASLPSTPAHPANLSAIKPGISMDALMEGISLQIAGASTTPLPVSIASPSRLEAERLRLSSSEWTWAATPAFSVLLGPGGSRAAIRVERGSIAAFIDEGGRQTAHSAWASRLSAYLGKPFSIPFYEEMNAIVAAARRRSEETP